MTLRLLETVFIVGACMVSPALAEWISVDADAWSDGTILDNSVPGITMSAVGIEAGLDGHVYAATDPLASTGTRVFSHSAAGLHWWRLLGNTGQIDKALRVDFNQCVSGVRIDFIGRSEEGYAKERGRLEAYDASGTLLQGISTGLMSLGDVETLSILRSDVDISYILAGGVYGEAYSAMIIDNFQYVPEPSSLALLALFGMALPFKRRKDRKVLRDC